MNDLSIQVLGDVEVLLDGDPIDLGTRKQRALFAALVVDHGTSVPVERLIAALWGPDAPERRRSDLWVYVSRLRKALADAGDIISSTNGGYRLDVASDHIDAVTFTTLCEEGVRLHEDDPAAASVLLSDALGAWRGRPYGEFATEEFALGEVRRLEELRLTAVEHRIRADITWRTEAEVLPEAEALATAEPLRPGPTAALMLALHRYGRQQAALRAYSTFVSRLRDEAGLDPPESLRQLEEQILTDDPALVRSHKRQAMKLPAAIASFVGRTEELAAFTTDLEEHRLVTITGPGGVGKTTLALELARRFAPDLDGAALIDLTDIEDTGDAGGVIASSLGLDDGNRSVDRITECLDGRRVLLVFDNCETDLAATADAATDLLTRSEELRIIATSRLPLGISGEQIRRLGPLPTGEDQAAERLLVERISDAGVTSLDRASIRALTEHTGGIPLGIEIAAAQLRTWPVRDVIDALSHPLDPLPTPERSVPERHRSLRSSIAWNERLLSPEALLLLGRISVFRDGFTSQAAIEVASFEPLHRAAAATALVELIDASLVLADPDEDDRYRVLEPVRQYGSEGLEVSGASATVGQRHASHYLEAAWRNRTALEFGLDPELTHQAIVDSRNLVAACRWAALHGAAALSMRGAIAAFPIWQHHAPVTDTLALVDTLMDADPSPSKHRAELLFLAAPVYANARGAGALDDVAAEIARLAADLDDPEVTGWAALRRADAASLTSDDPVPVIEQYRIAERQLGAVESPQVMRALHQLGWYLYWLWDRRDEVEEVLAAWRRAAASIGSPSQAAMTTHLSAWIGLAAQDHRRVLSESAAAERSLRRIGNHAAAAQRLLGLAIGLMQAGQNEDALRQIDAFLVSARVNGIPPFIANGLFARTAIATVAGHHTMAWSDLAEIIDSGSGRGDDDALRNATLFAARLMVTADASTAARLLGTGRPARTTGRYRMTHRLLLPAVDAALGDPEAEAERQLGTDAYRELHAEGTAMSIGAITEELRRVLDDAPVDHHRTPVA